MGKIYFDSEFSTPAITKVTPKITLNQKAHQQISAQLEKVYDPEIYTDSFDLVPTTMKYKLHLYIHPTDSGYAHGQLSWTPNTFVNGSYIFNDLNVEVTDATPISSVVIPEGYDDYYLYNAYDKFYEDTNYDVYKNKSELSGKVIVFDLDNYLVRSGSASSMFSSNTSITDIDLTNINVVNCVNLGGMFQSCSALKSVNVSNFNTTKCTNLSYMFCGCSNLESIDLSNFDTTKVTSMSNMFQYCNKLRTIDLSNFNTNGLTRMSYMFQSSGVRSVDLTSFNTANVTSMGYLFASSSIVSLDLSNFDTSNATDMGDMFWNCYNLETIDLSNFDTSKNNMGLSGTFYNCTKLEYIIIGSSTFKFQLKSSISLPNNCKILVPSALISTYQNATNWSAHASKFDAIENYDIVRSNGQVTVTPKNA